MPGDHSAVNPVDRGWVLDLDGVIWLAHEPIAGAAQAVDALRAAGERVAFVTNSAQAARHEVARRLADIGIDAGDDVFTSAMAAASLVSPGDRVVAFAGGGVLDALAERGAEVVPDGPADAVVVGKHEDLTYRGLRSAARAVRNGARFIATNSDPTYPTPSGLDPGAGALVAAVATASGRQPDIVAGKPHDPMAALVRGHVGTHGVVVGDVASTDGRFAAVLGFRWALVLSGVTKSADGITDPEPDGVFADLPAAVSAWLETH